MNRNVFKSKVECLVNEPGNRYWDYDGRNLKFDWCAIFASFCMRELANIPMFPKTASCGAIKAWGKENNLLNTDFRTAEVGDILLFELHNPLDGPEHVGIVIGNDNGFIRTIEGNTGNDDYNKSSVNVYRYPTSSFCFDSIVDMSSYFCDEESNKEETDYRKFKDACDKINDLLNKLYQSS